MSRSSVSGQLKLFQRALQVPTARENRPQIVAGSGGFRIQLQRPAEFGFRGFCFVLEQQVVTQVVMQPVGSRVPRYRLSKGALSCSKISQLVIQKAEFIPRTRHQVRTGRLF